MARRIAVAVLALITALLAVVAIPLGLLTAAQARRDFQAETAADGSTLANVAEERIDDGRTTALNHSVAYWQGQGDQVAVYDASGRWVAGTRTRPPGGQVTLRPPAPAAQLLVGGPAGRDHTGRADSGSGAIGTVELARSSEPLDHRVLIVWALIGGVSAAGLVAAGIVAIGLARWVSPPITALAGAARDLGDGALDTRAQVSSGPPEARRLAQAFNTMAARIESLVQGHQMLIADVSHQVRTPLAALRLRLDLLSQDADDVTAAELAGAQEEIARLARLTNGLLAVARAENATAPPVLADVAAVVRDRVAAWRPAAEERGVTLTVTASGPAAAQLGDGHLEQILDNLLANALDALPAGKTITVTAGPVAPAEAGPAGAGATSRGAATLGATGRGAAAAAAAAPRRGQSHRQRQRPRDERAATARRVPPVRLRHGGRHRAGARHRRPAGGRQRRLGVAVGHPGRWPHRDDRVPAAGPQPGPQPGGPPGGTLAPSGTSASPGFPPRPAELYQF